MPSMRCDLCGGSAFEEISDRDRHGRPLRTGICLGCGLVSHMPVPGEAEMAEYYATRYRRDYHGESTPSPRRIMRAWKNGERIHARLAPYLKPGARIFEVGAGIGCTVKVFGQNGFDAAGIEPNRDFNRFTRERLKADVANVNLFDLPPAADRDAVLLIHVIEHFTSPSRALRHIHAMLGDNGLLYVECPNLAAPFATFGRLFHYAHIYNFIPATLALLAARCGFALERQCMDANDPDIQMLFRCATPVNTAPDPGHADEVKRAIRRYNWLTYNLRPSYLSRRGRKLASYAHEYIAAPGFVRRLLQSDA